MKQIPIQVGQQFKWKDSPTEFEIIKYDDRLVWFRPIGSKHTEFRNSIKLFKQNCNSHRGCFALN